MNKLVQVMFALTLLAVAGGLVGAQDSGPKRGCGALSEQDCALWREARPAQAANFVAQMVLDLAEEREGGRFSSFLAATISGRYAASDEQTTAPGTSLEHATNLDTRIDVYAARSQADVAAGRYTHLVSFDTRLVGGTIYVNLGTLRSPMGLSTSGQTDRWVSTDLNDLLSALERSEPGRLRGCWRAASRAPSTFTAWFTPPACRMESG